MNIKQLSRNVIAHCLYYTGVLSLLGKKRFKDRALVLMYHRVVTEQDKSHCLSHDGIIVSKAAFEKQMRFLRDRFNVLSLNDFIDCIEGRKAFGYKSCLVTFDDGWKDNFQNAYPVLKEIGIPAVIFLRLILWGTISSSGRRESRGCSAGFTMLAISDRQFHGAAFCENCPDKEIERILMSARGKLRGEVIRYISILKEKSKEEIEEIIQRLSELTGKSATEMPGKKLL